MALHRALIAAYSPSGQYIGDAGATVDSAQRVSAWADQSGNSRNWAQATDGYKPLLSRADNLENYAVSSEDISPADHIVSRSVKVSATEWKEDATASATHQLYQVLPSMYVTAFSVKVKRGTGTRDARFYLLGPTNFSVAINLATGALTLGANTSATVSGPDGEGYYKIDAQWSGASAPALSTSFFMRIAEAGGNETYNGDNTSSIHTKEFHIRRATSDPTYIKTTTHRWHAGINGHRTLVFDGVDDLMTGTTLNNYFGASAKTLFTVFKMPTPVRTVNQAIFGNNSCCQFLNYVTTAGQYRAFNFDGTSDNTPIVALTANEIYIAAITHDGTTLRSYLNGSSVEVASGASTNLAGYTAWLGGLGTARAMMELAEIVIVPSELPADVVKTISDGLTVDYSILSHPSFAFTNSEYLINLKATIKAKHKKTLATQNIVVTSIKQPFATEESFPVLIDCAGIGSTTHNEIPSELRGQLTINNGYEIGFKRRFTDLLDDYVLVNQEIVIDVVDNNTGETYSSNTAVINSVDFNPNNSTANISVTKRALETHELNYTIKDGVNVIDGAQGQILPAIFGADKQVKPVRMTKNIWGYGTNMYDADNDIYSKNGTPTIYAADSNGYLTEIQTAPTANNGLLQDWTVTSWDTFEDYPFEGLTVGFRPRVAYSGGYAVPGSASLEPLATLTGKVLHSVTIAFQGSATISSVLDGELFTVEIWESGLDSVPDPIYGATVPRSIPEKMVASCSVPRTDYDTEIMTSAVFTVTFTLDRPVPLTIWPNALDISAEKDYLTWFNHTIILRQGFSALSESVSLALWDVDVYGYPATSTDEVWSYDFFYKISDDDQWMIATSSVFTSSLNPVIKLYGCGITADDLTPAETVTEGLSTIAPNDGLTPSIIKITSNTLSGNDTLTYDDLNLVVEVDGLSKVGASTTCATTPAEQAELLLSYYTSGAWTNTAFNSSAFSATHSPAIYSRSPEAVLTGMTLSRDALGEMLFWHHGKLFQTETDTKKLGLFLFGTVQTLAAIISEEDCIIDRVQELDLSTVVNNPSFQFGKKLMALSPVGLSNEALKFQDYFFSGSTSGYQLGSRQSDSQTLFGTNLMRKNTSEWIGENTTARSSAMLLVERYALPAFYILIRVPLRRYNDLKLGDVVLLSHSNLPYIGGGDASSFDAALYDGSALSIGAANGAYQVSGKSYKSLIEGRELYLRNGEPPMLKLSLLSLHNTGEGII